jgi:hypothetical protein
MSMSHEKMAKKAVVKTYSIWIYFTIFSVGFQKVLN